MEADPATTGTSSPNLPLKPVSQTAFYCSGARMWDAQRRWPVCGDSLAARFMDAAALEFFQPYRKLFGTNISCAVRHRMIDDLVRDRLRDSPDTLIVVIGAGFDSRAYRLPSGRYLEVDEAALMVYKETCLPANTAKNPLTRLTIDFATECLTVKLAPFRTTTPVIVIVEGVTMYLSQSALQNLAQSIRQTFPQAELIADIMSEPYGQKYGRPIRNELAAVEAQFQFSQPPAEVFQSQGFRPLQRISIFEQTLALSFPRVPRAWWPVLLKATPQLLREGYLIWQLAPAEGGC